MMLQVNKPMKELPILIVGTGRMCNLAAEYFIKIGYESIIFFSNEPDERGMMKLKYNALVLPISTLPKKTRENNIIFSAVSPDTTRISIESLGENWDTFSIIDLSVPKYIFRSDSDTSNVYLLDMEGIQHIAPDYLPGLQTEIDKCEHIIHEEISRFVSDNRRRRELNISHLYT
jgi:glutamyl-tRNA reductase